MERENWKLVSLEDEGVDTNDDERAFLVESLGDEIVGRVKLSGVFGEKATCEEKRKEKRVKNRLRRRNVVNE